MQAATGPETGDLRTLIVDDEPLAVERMQVICAAIDGVTVVGTASDGEAALRLAEALGPDLVLLDLTMPGIDGLTVARKFAGWENPPAVIFVTAHDEFAVEAFDLDAIDYVLKPVAPDRLDRAVRRVVSRRGQRIEVSSEWLAEFWVPHRSELVRVPAGDVRRIDAERDYVRLHVNEQSFLLLQTITGLEERLDPQQFIRIHRSCTPECGRSVSLEGVSRPGGCSMWRSR
ncbi:MAG: response regulator transcription factor [Novosphingobium sp.]